MNNKMNYCCRICLIEDSGEFVSLFDNKSTEDSLSERIMHCTNLKLCDIDGLPSGICAPCCNDLTIADNFRSKCINSDIILRKMYPHYFFKEDAQEIKDLDVGNKIATGTVLDDLKSSNLPCKEAENVDVRSADKIAPGENENIDQIEIKVESEDVSKMDSPDFLTNDLSESEDERPLKAKRSRRRCGLSDIKSHVSSMGNVIKEEWTEGGEGAEAKGRLKVYVCQECGKPLSKRSSLRRHIENVHSQEKKASSLTSSRKTGHGKDKRFHCQSCPYVTKFSQSLVYHERIHTGERPHKCPHCSRSFSQPGSLSCHLKTHSDKTYYTCSACGKQFKHKDSYEVHKLIHNENRELFTCEICNTSLKSRKTLESHMNRHNNIKNFNCETCGLQFVTLVELINHSKKHNTEKIHKCNFCDFRTALKRSLQSHTKRHSNYRPFKCQNCDLSCFTKWELKNHEKTHTRECNYTCRVCQRKFIHSSSVNKHMLRTHGIKYQRTDNVDRRKVK